MAPAAAATAVAVVASAPLSGGGQTERHGGGQGDRLHAETQVRRSCIDVLAAVKGGFAKRFAFKPLTASARVDELPGRGQLRKTDLSGQDHFGAPRARSVWPPFDRLGGDAALAGLVATDGA